jgi:hypothetical protein
LYRKFFRAGSNNLINMLRTNNRGRLIFLILSTFLCMATNAQSTRTKELQRATLTILRDFRDTLNPKKGSPAGDSLFSYTTQLINVVKTQDDTNQLHSITSYFKTAMENYQIADVNGQNSLTANLNRDLTLKVHFKRAGQLNIENFESLFNDVRISVLVDINGFKQVNGKYTLFWAPFTGINQAKIISSGAHVGNSTSSANPYDLIVKLPGYVTFWIEETTSGKIYRCNPEYLVFPNDKDQNIEVNFVPL